MRAELGRVIGCILLTASGLQASSFDDIQFWTGSGPHQAALVVDWMGDAQEDQSVVWGYRWEGEATGADMLLAVAADDPRLFIKLQDHGANLGISLYGIGYDDGDRQFSLTDATPFDAAGIAEVAGPADGAMAVDPDDLYAEGWFTAFWHYGVASGNPFEGGSWSSAGEGPATRILADGEWDSWAYTPSFSLDAFAQNPIPAAVPEPQAIVLALLALPALLRACRQSAPCALLLFVLLLSPSAALADSPYAAEVMGYIPGDPIGVASPGPYQTDGRQALGEPARDTGFGSQVGVFYAPFESDELVIIGAGGELTVGFDHPVEDDPGNPFGVDLLIFGNAIFVPGQGGVATDAFAEPGNIAVSEDNETWYEIPDRFADDLFPTLGYVDTVNNGFGNTGGTIPTDFTRPVDPTLNAIGLREAEINAAYAGSGGGTGIDLATVGLDSIRYVRVWQPADATWSTEVDAFADVAPVPEPSAGLLASAALVWAVAAGRSRGSRIRRSRRPRWIG